MSHVAPDDGINPSSPISDIVGHITPFLTEIAARMTPRRGALLDELVQEGAIAGCDAVGKFDPTRGVPFPAYLIVVAKNAMRNAAAKERRHRRRYRDGSGLDDDPDRDSAPPDDALIDREDTAAVNAAVERLRADAPDDASLVERLYGLGEREPVTAASIAAERGVSDAAVSQRKRRVLKRLRDTLAL